MFLISDLRAECRLSTILGTLVDFSATLQYRQLYRQTPCTHSGSSTICDSDHINLKSMITSSLLKMQRDPFSGRR